MLKDWKRISWGTTKKAFRIDHKKLGTHYYIHGTFTLFDKEFLITIYKKNLQIIYKKFKTKSQALKFAKKYMRTH